LKIKSEKSNSTNLKKVLSSVRNYRDKILDFEKSIKGVRSLYDGIDEGNKAINLMSKANDEMERLIEMQYESYKLCK
jgi:hypothetical protein